LVGQRLMDKLFFLNLYKVYNLYIRGVHSRFSCHWKTLN
jgi:hypothetical protein